MKFLELVRPDININFMGRRKLWMWISACLLALCLLPVLISGVNYGIDFAGGMLVQVKFSKPVEADQVRSALAPLNLGEATIQRFGDAEDNELLIRAQNPQIPLAQVGETVRKALSDAFPEQTEVRRVETVGPKVGQDLRNKALMAIFFSLLLMAVYISGRFEAKWILSGAMALLLGGLALLLEPFIGIVGLIVMAVVVTFLACWILRLRYALGAVAALCHDVIITVGIYTFLGKEFNLSTVAALLTIIGFSINDTIIIYDRVRENLRKSSRKPLELIINQAVNQTLSRTILTSGTVLLVLIILYAMGGGIIEDFAFTLLVGVVAGTYSSIYIASSLVLMIPDISSPFAKLGKSKPAGKTAARPVYQGAAVEGGEEARPAASPASKTAGPAALARRRPSNKGRKKK